MSANPSFKDLPPAYIMVLDRNVQNAVWRSVIWLRHNYMTKIWYKIFFVFFPPIWDFQISLSKLWKTLSKLYQNSVKTLENVSKMLQYLEITVGKSPDIEEYYFENISILFGSTKHTFEHFSINLENSIKTLSKLCQNSINTLEKSRNGLGMQQ